MMINTRLRLLTAFGLLLVISAMSPGSAEAKAPEIKKAPSKRSAKSVQLPRGGPFSAKSVWKKRIDKAPLAKNSRAMVRNLVGQVTPNWGGVAAFNVDQYATNVYVVQKWQKRVTVRFNDCQGKGYVPAGLFGAGGQFVGVPVPSNATPSFGTDKTLVIYQPSTDTSWEFWQMTLTASGWSACWGGRLDHVSTSGGWFSGGHGVTATGLSSIGGAIGIRDVMAGRIEHALTLQLISPASWTKFSWPAQRSDGFSNDKNAIPEGTRLRLDPKVNINKLHLTPIGKMVARAAQQYGFIVTDKSGAVSVVAESGYATKQVTGKDPWAKYMHGEPSYHIMRNFPWSKMQVLPPNYGRTA